MALENFKETLKIEMNPSGFIIGVLNALLTMVGNSLIQPV